MSKSRDNVDTLDNLPGPGGSALVGFVQSGSGAIARTMQDKARDIVSVKDFGATGDSSTDDTTNFNAAIAACKLSGAALYVPDGTYKITSSLTTITGQFTMYGDGPFKSRIQFAPTANDTLLELSNGASRAEHVVLRDFAMYSTDTTYTKIAMDVYDLSQCVFERLFIHGTGMASGPGAGAGWSDGSATSIGIRTHGREATGLSDISIFADKPIVIAANPNTDADDGEDMDHWNWQNLYLVGNGNPLISVDTGLGVNETVFGGYQAWVGGTVGCKINDTRAAPVVPSRGIEFFNVRREQGTSASDYVFDLTFTVPVQQITFDKVLMAAGTKGIKLDGFSRAVLDQVTAAMTSTDALTVANVTASSVLVFRGCIWQSGATVTTTGLTQIHSQAYRSASFSAPSDAVYAGQITDTQFNVAKARITAANAGVGFVITGTTGDGLQMLPQAAGSGVVVRAVNNAESDFEPLTLLGETVEIRYRTGVATSAVAATINSDGTVTFASLAGTGSRTVVADANGKISAP